jgi:hypothetical protein
MCFTCSFRDAPSAVEMNRYEHMPFHSQFHPLFMSPNNDSLLNLDLGNALVLTQQLIHLYNSLNNDSPIYVAKIMMGDFGPWEYTCTKSY